MREHMHYASRRRDDGLARVRRLSLWITGGAAAASLGLGAAFAHELPGHASAATNVATRGGATAAGSHRIAGGPSRPGTGNPGAGDAGTAKSGGHHHQHALAKPAQAPQQPASAPAPPQVVSSGGS